MYARLVSDMGRSSWSVRYAISKPSHTRYIYLAVLATRLHTLLLMVRPDTRRVSIANHLPIHINIHTWRQRDQHRRLHCVSGEAMAAIMR
jgi:hypothetical protein